MRLVEVIEIEYKVALRRGVESEVAEVRIAADHRFEAGFREARKVLRHQGSRTAQKGVGRSRHSANPHWNQVVQTSGVSFLDELDRVSSILFGLPAAQFAPFHAFPQRTAGCPSFFIRGQGGAQFLLHRSLLLSKVVSSPDE